ncbi:DUF899 family protein [Asanoa iriomotensis]|uniref:DUF899 domain-containing protein n=1 Tax=Asanoa iriomotensis TaxID=234613 RepID=A0ABQ4BXD2_9ACTN|nr:DUF899 family protein [Asanoa iriomotensis]GIF55194.1 hypothetical protein Air01nite_12890 [Asanoa iriomotensis]
MRNLPEVVSFDGRPQLVMHHFMFGPDWDLACPSCSSAADQIGRLRQLHVRNTTLVAVPRAPYPKLAAYRERMGWVFPWYSSFGSDFNYDDRVAPVLLHFRTEAELAQVGTPWSGSPWTPDLRGTEMPGISAFLRNHSACRSAARRCAYPMNTRRTSSTGRAAAAGPSSPRRRSRRPPAWCPAR